ncbi:beta-defensin 131A-like [Diceros bicornis minor]|uniref:beta-defensin 131A-like n=1 Tax=Diceros bicornis minor TaxID=77932 RepID=UPI0026E93920|nr:beta-defensin 131A-like [Diceros bicornis minor]
MSLTTPLNPAANLLKIQRTQEHAEFSKIIFSLFKARSLFFNEGCPSRYYNCRMKCNDDEYAVRFCADWSICCRAKKIELKKRRKW